MREEEKRIHRRHEENRKELMKDIGKFQVEYADRRKALEASYGTGNIPDEAKRKLIKYAEEQHEKFEQRKKFEEQRYMREIDAYDERRTPSRINDEPKKNALAAKALNGWPVTPLHSKFLADYNPTISKDKPEPKKAPDKGKEEEREL